MHPRGFLNLSFFYFVWLSACFVIPISIWCFYLGFRWPCYCLAMYYTYRYIFPASQWEWMRSALCSDNTPYCRTAKIILDDNATAPRPGDKTMTTVAPHGILTLGWAYLISSELFRISKTRWLVAPLMTQLPFISDVMK